jgi:DNA-binding PadR family transcriptional regulator
LALLGGTRLLFLNHDTSSRTAHAYRLLTKVSHQAITKDLRMMEGAGLVRSTWHGRASVWQLAQQRLTDARRYLDLISKQWDDALSKLRELVED